MNILWVQIKCSTAAIYFLSLTGRTGGSPQELEAIFPSPASSQFLSSSCPFSVRSQPQGSTRPHQRGAGPQPHLCSSQSLPDTQEIQPWRSRPSIPEPQREDAQAAPTWAENQYQGAISQYYCNTSLGFKQPMSEELRQAITKFLSAIHWAFKLPASQSNNYTWNHECFFPSASKTASTQCNNA